MRTYQKIKKVWEDDATGMEYWIMKDYMGFYALKSVRYVLQRGNKVAKLSPVKFKDLDEMKKCMKKALKVIEDENENLGV